MPQKLTAKAKRRSRQDADENQADRAITKREVEEIEERSTPRTSVIYEIVRRQGDEEMARPFVSLWWSGVAAGSRCATWFANNLEKA